MSVKFANFYIAAMQNFLLWLYAGGKLFFQHPENKEICQDIEDYIKVFFNSFFIPLIGNSADKTSDRLLGSVELTK